MKPSLNQKIIVRCSHGREWEDGEGGDACVDCLLKIKNNQIDTVVHHHPMGWISFSKEEKKYQLYENKGLQ